jgi:hypothetical protein
VRRRIKPLARRIKHIYLRYLARASFTMDIEALKEQWSEIEDRDGLRLSWNVFPSSRMVCLVVIRSLDAC